VQTGNPKNISTLADLAKPGLKLAIANPESVCVGLYAVEIIEKDMSAAEKTAFRANLLNYTDSCDKTATAIALKQVDAVIGAVHCGRIGQSVMTVKTRTVWRDVLH
jgi:molybdate transport system substrate-binding protein